MFLRTLEFYWQEGHTAHETAEEAEEETLKILKLYTDFAVNEAAVPVIPGVKSNAEKFAGAKHSYSIEAMMLDTKALQSGTSHNLGQNFAKAFEIQYLDRNNELQYAWTTSWGVSTRFVGAIIMTHGDDQGLIMPPRLAPIQIVIVPIFRTDEDRLKVMDVVRKIESNLSQFRVKVDDRDNVSPGFKFNDWELRGVPLRIEIGPRDVDNQTVVVAQRDIPGKSGKLFLPIENLPEQLEKILDDFHNRLLQKAIAFRDSHIFEPKNYSEFQDIVQNGWAYAYWCGDVGCEIAIKNETKATTRCRPLDQEKSEGQCIYCGKPAEYKTYFAKAY
jgi:prolyl-tRNA synthetase